MLIACWSVKGGCGTSVIAAMLALALGPWSRLSGSASGSGSGSGDAPLLVDLTGDLPAVLGLPPASTPGVHEWLGAAAGPDALARLEHTVEGGGLRVLRRGERPPPDDAGERLVDALSASPCAVVDCGRPRPSSVTGAVVGGASVSLLVLRPCYLALGRALDAPLVPSAVALVDEPGRALGPGEIEDVLGVPVVVSIRARPAVARAVDAGLLSWRPPRRLVRALASAVPA